MVTAYDYSMSEYAHKSKMDMILVVIFLILQKKYYFYHFITKG
jgi:ketopantoate hydroxymethyltransferase